MAGFEHIFRRWHPLARLALFAAAYISTVRLCSLMAFQPESASALWLPSGVVLGALLLARGREQAVVALFVTGVGPFLYATGRLPSLLGFLLAAGSALEGLAGAFLLRRVLRLHPSLERVRDVAYLGVGAFASAALNATLSVGFMALTGAIPWSTYGRVWSVFWVGDTMGILVLTPLLLAWAARSWRGWSLARGVELVLVLAVLGVVTDLLFQAGSSPSATSPLKYHLLFPLVLWAALRFEARGTTAATAVLSTITLWHTLHGHGPFGAGSPFSNERLTFLQSFLATAVASGLLMAAALAERRRAREEVTSLNEELSQSLETLARAQERLVRRERLAALGELAATVAHEVRNPLGAITNALAALRRMGHDPGEGPAGALFGIVDEEVERLAGLVSGLLDLTRPMEPRRVPQPLAAVVEGALVAALRAAGPTAPPVTVVKELAADLGPIPVDGQLVHVALSNLLTNALQSMPSGGSLTVRLERELRAGAAYARLTIQDTGRGIPPELLTRIFEPFFTTRSTGTGLGLAIVRRIVEAHRGEVVVRSTLGEGTTFVVHLPCAPESARLPAVSFPGPAGSASSGGQVGARNVG
jgi:signal transduction histidine kinase